MSITVEFCHICNHAFLNNQQQPCLIGILRYLVAPSFPYHRSTLSVAARIRGDAGEAHHLDVILGPEDGPFLRRAPFDFTPAPKPFSSFLSLQMVQLFFPKAGQYTAKITSGDLVLATAYLTIIGPNQPPPEQHGELEVTRSPD